MDEFLCFIYARWYRQNVRAPGEPFGSVSLDVRRKYRAETSRTSPLGLLFPLVQGCIFNFAFMAAFLLLLLLLASDLDRQGMLPIGHNESMFSSLSATSNDLLVSADRKMAAV